MRRSLVAIGVIEVALGLMVACATFSGDDAPASADASDEDGGGGFDAPADTQSDADAAPPRCSSFDVDAASQPPSSICGGASKNLAGDPQNCGWCGHQCLGSPVCTNGVCQPFALVTGPGGSSLHVVRVDDSDIYWVDTGRNPSATFRSPHNAAGTELGAALLAEVDASEPVNTIVYGLAIDDRIYLHTYSNFYQAPLDGGPLTVFNTISPGGGGTPLATTGSHLLQASPSGAAFFDFLKSDGGLVAQQSGIGGAYDLAVTPDGRYAFLIGRTAVDAGVVDGSAVTRGGLYRYTLATRDMTLVTVIDAMGAQGSVLTADNEFVYFPEGGTGSILALAVDAPANAIPTVLSKGDGRRVQYITSDASRVYWLSSNVPPDYYNWDLLGVDKCGGADRKYVRREDGLAFLPGGLDTRGPNLYWSTGATIYTVAK